MVRQWHHRYQLLLLSILGGIGKGVPYPPGTTTTAQQQTQYIVIIVNVVREREKGYFVSGVKPHLQIGLKERKD